MLQALSAGATIGLSVVIVVIILLCLDLMLLYWRRQGVIAAICLNKSKKNKLKGQGERYFIIKLRYFNINQFSLAFVLKL